MLHRFRFVIVSTLVVLTSAVVSYAVSASVPNSFRPSGTTRYAVASATDPITTTSGTYADIPGMSTSITIPAGKRGDIMILFCANTYMDLAGTTMNARAMVGGSAATPNQVEFHTNNLELESHCATFYKLNKPEGATNVRIQWNQTGNALGTAGIWNYRTMIVTVNIHD